MQPLRRHSGRGRRRVNVDTARTVAGKVPELCACFPLRALIYTMSGLYPELPANQKDK